MSTIIIGCGSRDWQDRDRISVDLAQMSVTHEVKCVFHGAARGADRLVGEAAEAWGLHVEAFPAQWERLGRSAGFRRNAEMLNAAQRRVADGWASEIIVLGWKVNPDRSLRRGGTEHMLKLAVEAGVRAHLHDGFGWSRLDTPLAEIQRACCQMNAIAPAQPGQDWHDSDCRFANSPDDLYDGLYR